MISYWGGLNVLKSLVSSFGFGFEVNPIMATLNSGNPNIKWEQTGIGRFVIFLDMSLECKPDVKHVIRSLYRKPTNSYAYVPVLLHMQRKGVIVDELLVKMKGIYLKIKEN